MNAPKVKRMVRIRNGFKCAVCGMTQNEHVSRFGRNLDVHRLVPGSEYTVEGCSTRCRPCHYKEPKSPRGTADWNVAKIPACIAEAAASRSECLVQSLAQYVNDAVRMRLEAEGKWPQPQKK